MITFVIADDKVYVENDKFHAEAIRGMMTGAGDVDLEVVVPQVYHSDIDNYINFINSVNSINFTEFINFSYSRRAEITSADKLTACFNMNTYFLDGYYFDYLIEQLLLHWSPEYGDFGSVVLQFEETNVHLARDIELRLPFHLIADGFKLYPSFVKEWMEVKGNKLVTMDAGLKVVESAITYYPDETKITRDQSSQPTNEITAITHLPYPWSITVLFKNISRYRTRYLFYPDYKLVCERPYADEGTHFQRVDGVERGWYESGQLRNQINYSDGQRDGLFEWFAEDGTLMTSGQYYRGHQDGDWYNYDPGTQVYSYTHYVDGNKDGPYSKFAADGLLLLKSGNYKRNSKIGSWYNYDPSLGLAYEVSITHGQRSNRCSVPVRLDYTDRPQVQVQPTPRILNLVH